MIKHGKTRKLTLDEFDLFKDYPKEQIKILKDALSQTDYQAIKYAEGELTEEEYAPIREQRKAWRQRINDLEVNK